MQLEVIPSSEPSKIHHNLLQHSIFKMPRVNTSGCQSRNVLHGNRRIRRGLPLKSSLSKLNGPNSPNSVHFVQSPNSKFRSPKQKWGSTVIPAGPPRDSKSSQVSNAENRFVIPDVPMNVNIVLDEYCRTHEHFRDVLREFHSLVKQTCFYEDRDHEIEYVF